MSQGHDPLTCELCHAEGTGAEISHLFMEAAGLRVALEAISDADPVDMALDPGWAARIARDALGDRP